MTRIFSAVLAIAIVTGLGTLIVNSTNEMAPPKAAVSDDAAPAPAPAAPPANP
jgi:hypothetical protein